MGSWVSSERSSLTAAAAASKNDESCANVVTLSGVLRQYSLPATVFQVLGSESCSAVSAPAASLFLCDSDSLSFEDYIPALAPGDNLQPAQIYFVLPVSKLNYRLTGPDMAALAVKASTALQSHNNNARLGKSKSRISPVILTEEVTNDSYPPAVQTSVRSGSGISGSGSVGKLQRYSSRRVKLAVRSFNMRLNTIYE